MEGYELSNVITWPSQMTQSMFTSKEYPPAEFFIDTETYCEDPSFFLLVPRKTNKLSVNELLNALTEAGYDYDSHYLYVEEGCLESGRKVVNTWSGSANPEELVFADRYGYIYKEKEISELSNILLSNSDLLMVPMGQKIYITISDDVISDDEDEDSEDITGYNYDSSSDSEYD